MAIIKEGLCSVVDLKGWMMMIYKILRFASEELGEHRIVTPVNGYNGTIKPVTFRTLKISLLIPQSHPFPSVFPAISLNTYFNISLSYKVLFLVYIKY